MGKGEETKDAILDEALQLASRVGFTGPDHRPARRADRDEQERAVRPLPVQGAAPAADPGARAPQVHRHHGPAGPGRAPRREAGPRAVRALAALGVRGAAPAAASSSPAPSSSTTSPGPMRDALVARPAGLARRRSPPSPRPRVAEGDFREDTDPDQFAFEIQGLTLGYHHFARLLDDEQADRPCPRGLRGHRSTALGRADTPSPKGTIMPSSRSRKARSFVSGTARPAPFFRAADLLAPRLAGRIARDLWFTVPPRLAPTRRCHPAASRSP